MIFPSFQLKGVKYRNPDDGAAGDEVAEDLDSEGIDVAVVELNLAERRPGHDEEDEQDDWSQKRPADFPVETRKSGQNGDQAMSAFASTYRASRVAD